MKILKLETENFMNIKLVKIDLNGRPLVISGDNAQGKSSLRNALFSMLEGLKVSKPVRDGETSANLRLEIGDETGVKFIVEEVHGKGEKFRVTAPPTADGAVAEYGSPRKFLSQFLSFVSVDPGQLADLLKSDRKDDQRKAREIVIDLLSKHGKVDLRKQLEAFDNTIKLIKQDRSDALQRQRWIEDEIKRAIPAEIVEGLETIPDQLLEAEPLLKKIKDFENAEAKYDFESRQVKELLGDVKELESEASQTEKEIKALQAKISKLKTATENKRAEAREKVEYLKTIKLDPDQKEACLQELAGLTAQNAKIKAKQDFLDMKQKAQEAADHASNLLKQANETEKAKQAAIVALRMPLEGLSLGEEGLLFKNLPLSVESESQLILIATSILIAMNPKLKTIILRNGNVFTKKHLDEYLKWADDKGYQIITEYVDDTGQIGLYIEAGEVKRVNGEKVD